MSQSNLQRSVPIDKLVSLGDLKFDNRFVRELPGDPETHNGSRQVSNACYTRVDPTPVKAPRLLAGRSRSAKCSASRVRAPPLDRKLRRWPAISFCLACSRMPRVTAGISSAIGRVSLAMGARLRWRSTRSGRNQRELQLKGAGRTPYSRTADGRAVLRSSVREFLCSEAMHHLGVPTTRALSLVATGDAVVRDMFYNGNPQAEPGAVVCRVAPSFVRFGNFEIFAAHGELELLRRLSDYVIAEHFPELLMPSPAGTSTALADRWIDRCMRAGSRKSAAAREY